jgi:hypothetical protein
MTIPQDILKEAERKYPYNEFIAPMLTDAFREAYAEGVWAERQKLPQAVGDAIDWTLNYAEVRKYGDPPYEEEVIELDDKLKSEYISKLNPE